MEETRKETQGPMSQLESYQGKRRMCSSASLSQISMLVIQGFALVCWRICYLCVYRPEACLGTRAIEPSNTHRWQERRAAATAFAHDCLQQDWDMP